MTPTPSTAEIKTKVWEILGKFLSKKQRAGLTEETRLFHDLYIAGDDADEFLAQIVTTFGTSFETADFQNYFPDETEAVYYWICMQFFGHKGKNFKQLPLGHLIAVVQAGQWFEPTQKKC